VKPLLVLCCLSSLACTTILYNGPTRDPAQVATISSGTHATVARIDGIAVNGGGTGNYVVLPGPHTVQVVGQKTDVGLFSNTVHQSRRMGSCFVASPGHTYDVRASLSDGYWTSDVYDVDTENSVDEGECLPSRRDGAGANPSDAVLARPPHPGTGFSVALGGDLGGDNLVSASMSNGDNQSIDAGSGVYGTIGASLTPLWLGDVVGFGAGSRIGIKYDSIDAKNGSVLLTRYPFSLWIHSYLRISERWYFNIAGGAHKELSPGLSGDGVAAGVQANFQSPWGWMGELGLVFAETWHTAMGLSLRYTKMGYIIAGQTFDASNIGFGLTFYWNP